MRRLGKYERRAKLYAAYRSAAEGVKYYFLVRYVTPVWSSYKGPDREWAVYFRSRTDEESHARLIGHHVEKDLAYKMVFDFYMKTEDLSWEELQIKAAAAGVDTRWTKKTKRS